MTVARLAAVGHSTNVTKWLLILPGRQILFICDGKGLHVPEYQVKMLSLIYVILGDLPRAC